MTLHENFESGVPNKAIFKIPLFNAIIISMLKGKLFYLIQQIVFFGKIIEI